MSDEVRDESELFTEEEFFAAFSLIVSEDEARELARNFKEPWPEEEGSLGNASPAVLAPDTLDLLSLVSESCAERVRHIFRVSPEDAAIRRQEFAAKIGQL